MSDPDVIRRSHAPGLRRRPTAGVLLHFVYPDAVQRTDPRAAPAWWSTQRDFVLRGTCTANRWRAAIAKAITKTAALVGRSSTTPTARSAPGAHSSCTRQRWRVCSAAGSRS